MNTDTRAANGIPLHPEARPLMERDVRLAPTRDTFPERQQLIERLWHSGIWRGCEKGVHGWRTHEGERIELTPPPSPGSVWDGAQHGGTQ
jgi:hypothetical protein